MSAIILEILKNNPDKIFTQTEIIDEIENQTGKRKSKSAISQNIKTLFNRKQITYEKGLGRIPAKISLILSDIEKPKPKPIEKPKPKPIKKPKPKPIAIQLSQAEKTLDKGLTEFNESKGKIIPELTVKPLPAMFSSPELEKTKLPRLLLLNKKELEQAKEEITNLEVELAFVKGIKKRPFTFKEFSEYILSQSETSGSNSMKIGEIAFRKSDLKNFYLLILYLREESKL